MSCIDWFSGSICALICVLCISPCIISFCESNLAFMDSWHWFLHGLVLCIHSCINYCFALFLKSCIYLLLASILAMMSKWHWFVHVLVLLLSYWNDGALHIYLQSVGFILGLLVYGASDLTWIGSQWFFVRILAFFGSSLKLLCWVFLWILELSSMSFIFGF